ncbi:MAG: protein kinase [Ardenticatenaceae bacterium]
MSVYKTDAEIPAQWQVGDVMLDEIEVKAKLGAGHLGAKDLVYHRSFKVELAVTSVDADVSAGQTPDFMRQVGSWVQLGLHPHVVTCHYVREMGGVPRILAEYVADGSLADWISERRLYEGGHEAALGRMLDVAIQMAWGLSYAHEKQQFPQRSYFYGRIYHSSIFLCPKKLFISDVHRNKSFELAFC